MLDDAHFFTVTDLKQYTYCAREVYYEYCLPLMHPQVGKMEAGRDAHEAERRRAARRTMAGYDGVEAGERRFGVRLASEELYLIGELDEVVYANSGEVIPVDYKLSKRVQMMHKMQLGAYALLLEQVEAVKVRRGFVYLIPKRKFVEVKMTPKLRAKVRAALEDMRDIVENERMPSPPAKVARCVDCEFRRFCNDVL